MTTIMLQCLHQWYHKHQELYEYETIAGEGGNEIAFCFKKIMISKINRRSIIVWADNCVAKNKNMILIVLNFLLVAKQILDKGDIIYFDSGHSFMSWFQTDWKKKKAMVPDDLDKIIRKLRPSKLLKILHMVLKIILILQTLQTNLLTSRR